MIDAQMFGKLQQCRGVFFGSTGPGTPRIKLRITVQESMHIFPLLNNNCETSKCFLFVFEYLAFCTVCYGLYTREFRLTVTVTGANLPAEGTRTGL